MRSILNSAATILTLCGLMVGCSPSASPGTAEAKAANGLKFPGEADVKAEANRLLASRPPKQENRGELGFGVHYVGGPLSGWWKESLIAAEQLSGRYERLISQNPDGPTQEWRLVVAGVWTHLGLQWRHAYWDAYPDDVLDVDPRLAHKIVAVGVQVAETSFARVFSDVGDCSEFTNATSCAKLLQRISEARKEDSSRRVYVEKALAARKSQAEPQPKGLPPIPRPSHEFSARAQKPLSGCRWEGSLTTLAEIYSEGSGVPLGFLERAHLSSLELPKVRHVRYRAMLTWPLEGVVTLESDGLIRTARKVELRKGHLWLPPGVPVEVTRGQEGHARLHFTLGEGKGGIGYGRELPCRDLRLTMEDEPEDPKIPKRARELSVGMRVLTAIDGQLVGTTGPTGDWVEVLRRQGDWALLQSVPSIAPMFRGWVRKPLFTRGLQMVSATVAQPTEAATHKTNAPVELYLDGESTGAQVASGVPVIAVERSGPRSRVGLPGLSPPRGREFWLRTDSLSML